MKVGAHDTDRSVFIIAEIGNCHEGSLSLAEDLIGKAAEAGANAVKFQTIIPERLVSVLETERIQQLKKLCLTYDHFKHLQKIAQKENILFLSTPFDLESVEFLNPMVPAFKIASGDNDFFPLIRKAAETGKPIILSTGLQALAQSEAAVAFIKDVWGQKGISQDLALLHCVVSYPAPADQANLRAIDAMKSLGVTVGYSDHTIGIEAPVLAVALGARIIEKHFTIDKNYSAFRDHQLAADPKDLREMTDRIRNAEKMLGDGIKRMMNCEAENNIKVRRSIAAERAIEKGNRLSQEDIAWVRPGSGVRPGQESKLVGRVLKRDILRGEPLKESDVAPGGGA